MPFIKNGSFKTTDGAKQGTNRAVAMPKPVRIPQPSQSAPIEKVK